MLAALGGAGNALAQTASCNITYTWPTWVGGNGFGASIDIRNTGPAITNGWSLVFNFPNGQQLQNGWPVAFSQSGSTLTATSNAAWSNSIPTNGVFNVAFNGTFSGANNPPTAFTLNGTACTIGNSTNTPPTVSAHQPDSQPELRAGSRRATRGHCQRSGRRGGARRIPRRRQPGELRHQLALQLQRHRTRQRHSHACTATAVDNGNPALSTTTAAVTFTVGAGGNTAPQVSLTSPTANQNFASGAAVPLAATASDPGGAVVRVDFRLDGSTTVVGSDTTSPYNFTCRRDSPTAPTPSRPLRSTMAPRR